MKQKVIHLIPQDGLGGVEQAARSLKPSKDLDIQVAFICGESLIKNEIIRQVSGPKVKLNSPKFYLNAFKYLLKEKPDVLVSSLWRSNIVSVSYTLYRRLIARDDIQLIAFLHVSKFNRKLEWLLTKATMCLSNEIWCDSVATKDNLLKGTKFEKKSKVISFFIGESSNCSFNKTPKKNNFVFWGRLSQQKRVDKAIGLFKKIHNRNPKSLFYIYGPDNGELNNLKKLVKKLDLVNSVLFMGTKEPSEYPKEALSSKFFINTSSNEGMAIAVTEAMQLGIIPIVTPVGEIQNYCTNDENSIYFDESTIDKILNLLNDDISYQKMRDKAIQYWSNKPSYSDDFNSNCLRLIRS